MYWTELDVNFCGCPCPKFYCLKRAVALHTLCTEACSIPIAQRIPLMAWWGLHLSGKRAEVKGRGVGGCHIHVGDVMPDVTSLHPRTQFQSCSCLLKAQKVQLWGHCQQWKTAARSQEFSHTNQDELCRAFFPPCFLPQQLLRVIEGVFKEEIHSATVLQQLLG